MDKKKIIEVLNDVENKSNKDILESIKSLEEEFDKTKELIINLTRHLETVHSLHSKASDELTKRMKQ